MITNNAEDYLEIIFHLESEGKICSTKEIAKHLNISPASVSENIKKMADKNLLKYLPYKGVRLSDKGKKLAIDVVRRHRISERFLVDKLGFKLEDAHDEAHKLEHGISKSVGNKIYEMLGKPKTCPHGNPMPNPDGIIKEEKSYILSIFNKKDRVKIIKITDEDPKIISYLATLGLMPRINIVIEEKAPFNGPIIVRIGNATYALGKIITDSIWCKKI